MSEHWPLSAAALRAGIKPLDVATSASPAGWNLDMGLPDPATFPCDQLVRHAEQVLRQDRGEALLYGGPGRSGIALGHRGLREVLAARASAAGGRPVDADSLMLTNGAAQAIELIWRCLLDEGDVFAVEALTWGAVLRSGRALGARPVGIALDAQGMRVDDLASEIDRLERRGQRLKLVYTIATFNTPTGWSLSLPRRLELLRLAAQHGFVIVEDDVYRELRYGGHELPSLASLDEEGRVIQVGSFSKTIAPALRMGWLRAQAGVLAGLLALREDLGSSQWMARLLTRFLESGEYDAHLASVRALYRRKRDRVVAALAERCGDLVRFEVPDGGMFLWLQVADEIDGEELLRRAQRDRVACRPGEQFQASAEEALGQWMRMAFTMVPEDELDRGVAILARAMAGGRREPPSLVDGPRSRP